VPAKLTSIFQVWPRGQFPLRPVGELVLNRNPEDYHRDVEQVCFSPGSFVPGIEASPDALLQWRTFLYVLGSVWNCAQSSCASYRDAQYYRMGSANLQQVPVNCPFMAKVVSPDNFNGNMRVE
jgi:catalase